MRVQYKDHISYEYFTKYWLGIPRIL